MPFNPATKHPGDLLRSGDWNAAMTEVERLEADKVNLSGDQQITGGLSVQGSLGIGTTSPDRKLSVEGAGNCALNVRGDGGNREVLVGADDQGAVVSAMTDHDLILRAGGNVEKARIKTDGKLGIGVTNPDAELHLRGGSEPVLKVQSDENTSISARLALRQSNNRGLDLYFDGTSSTASGERLIVASQNSTTNAIADELRLSIRQDQPYLGVGLRDPDFPIHVQGGAHCTGSQWVDDCCRDSKTDIGALDSRKAQAVLSELNPVTYRYRRGDGHRRVGFIAEEVPDLVAQSDRRGISPMDILGVLTRVVQDQQREIDELRGRLEALQPAGGA